MGFNDLTEADRKVYEFIKAGDFQTQPWSTAAAAARLGMTEAAVYESIANLTKHIRDNIWVYYDNGRVHIVCE